MINFLSSPSAFITIGVDDIDLPVALLRCCIVVLPSFVFLQCSPQSIDIISFHYFLSKDNALFILRPSKRFRRRAIHSHLAISTTCSYALRPVGRTIVIMSLVSLEQSTPGNANRCCFHRTIRGQTMARSILPIFRVIVRFR